ncbi:uncharacterized protein METZ01_LOCUS446611, partial [marine metagenome]
AYIDGGQTVVITPGGSVGSWTTPAVLDMVEGSVPPTMTNVTSSWGASLNATERDAGGAVTVVTSGVENNQVVTVTLNNVAYTGTVANNSSVITVGAAGLQGLTDGNNYTLTANVSDAAGVAASEVKGTPFTVDTTAPSITSVTANWGASLNGAEDNSYGTVTVLTSGAEDNQPVTVMLNGADYTGIVGSNSASVTVAATGLQGLTDGSTYDLTVNVSDAAGNAAMADTGTSFTVDTTAPSITGFTASWGASLNATEV